MGHRSMRIDVSHVSESRHGAPGVVEAHSLRWSRDEWGTELMRIDVSHVSESRHGAPGLRGDGKTQRAASGGGSGIPISCEGVVAAGADVLPDAVVGDFGHEVPAAGALWPVAGRAVTANGTSGLRLQRR